MNLFHPETRTKLIKIAIASDILWAGAFSVLFLHWGHRSLSVTGVCVLIAGLVALGLAVRKAGRLERAEMRLGLWVAGVALAFFGWALVIIETEKLLVRPLGVPFPVGTSPDSCEVQAKEGEVDRVMKDFGLKKGAFVLLLVILIVARLLAWFVVEYPARAGYVSYEAAPSSGLDLEEAMQTLEDRGYVCRLDLASTYGQDPYLETADASHPDGTTLLSVSADMEGDVVTVQASREVYVPLYTVVGDLQEAERA